MVTTTESCLIQLQENQYEITDCFASVLHILAKRTSEILVFLYTLELHSITAVHHF